MESSRDPSVSLMSSPPIDLRKLNCLPLTNFSNDDGSCEFVIGIWELELGHLVLAMWRDLWSS